MDLNILRIVATLLLFAAFIAIVVWAMAGRRRADFDDAAMLPLNDEGGAPDNGGPHKIGEKK